MYGQACNSGSDCKSGICNDGYCGSPDSCKNLKQDPGETDVDCGGPDCPPCALTKFCQEDEDCLSLNCYYGICAEPTCVDGSRNQGETDVDCGGPCPRCPDGKHCLTNEDCEGGSCVDGTCCQENACSTCGPPPPEICNGLDDDCDDKTDEPADLVGGGPCPKQTGVCKGSFEECFGPKGWKCTVEVYQEHDSSYEPDEFKCDGLDNDCDGQTDEAPDCTCKPDCMNKECGSDGCDGSCGECPQGEACNDGKCVGGDLCGADPNHTCDGHCGGQGVGNCFCDTVCMQKQDCCPDYQECCGGPCEPDCVNKECGSDGCDGSCGECPEGLVCASGQCSDVPPVEEFGKSCDTDEDCYPGLLCQDLYIIESKICTMACTGSFTQSECPDGWLCFSIGLPSGFCVNYPG